MPVSHMTTQAYFFFHRTRVVCICLKKQLLTGFEYDYVSSVYLLKLSFGRYYVMHSYNFFLAHGLLFSKRPFATRLLDKSRRNNRTKRNQ